MTLFPQSVQIVVPSLGPRRYVEGDSIDASVPLVWTVTQLLSPETCRALIERIEAAGPTSAPITTARGFVMAPEIRNNTRVILDDLGLAAELWARVEPLVPPTMCGGQVACGVNERFRCYRYQPGERFAPHYDGAYNRDEREGSRLTFMVYLNEGFEGGETAFLDFGLAVRPTTGLALFFQHVLLHEGCVLVRGTKYAIRSDIMFRR
jgi:hypothetical protein